MFISGNEKSFLSSRRKGHFVQSEPSHKVGVRLRDHPRRRRQVARRSPGVLFSFRNVQVPLPALRLRQPGQPPWRKVPLHNGGPRLSDQRSAPQEDLARWAVLRGWRGRLLSDHFDQLDEESREQRSHRLSQLVSARFRLQPAPGGPPLVASLFAAGRRHVTVWWRTTSLHHSRLMQLWSQTWFHLKYYSLWKPRFFQFFYEQRFISSIVEYFELSNFLSQLYLKLLGTNVWKYFLRTLLLSRTRKHRSFPSPCMTWIIKLNCL